LRSLRHSVGNRRLVKSGAIDIIVIDSVAALVPKAELEGDMGDSHAAPPAAPVKIESAPATAKSEPVRADKPVARAAA
jgi:hypothetical protein